MAAEEVSDDTKDPTMGNNPVVEDFSILKQALSNVKTVLTPYDWIEFAQEYETQRGLRVRLERQERERRIKTGEESDDETVPEDELVYKKKMDTLAHAEHLKSRIVEVQNYFSDVAHALMQCHSHITDNPSNSETFVAVMRFVPKNSRDAVERLTEKNAELTKQIQEYDAKLEEISEYNEKRQNTLLGKHQTAFEDRKQSRLIRNVFSAMRCDLQTEWITRHRIEVAHLRKETKEQKKTIKHLNDELDSATKLLETFKAKHERQVKVAAEQLAKLTQMEETLDQLTSKIRMLEQEKRNLEISLKDEISRRKDAEYGLERAQEDLARKAEELAEVTQAYEETHARAEQLGKDLDNTKLALVQEQEQRELERRDSEKFKKQMVTKIKQLEKDYAELEADMTEKVSTLTSQVTHLTGENAHLTARVAHLEWEVEDTIRQWKENVAQVKREAAEELDRRSKEIYAAFAQERETHMRRLKIQNYELSKRDLYCGEAMDLNPLPVPELFSGGIPEGDENAATSPDGVAYIGPGGTGLCRQCKRAVVFSEEKGKHTMDLFKSPEEKPKIKSPGRRLPMSRSPSPAKSPPKLASASKSPGARNRSLSRDPSSAAIRAQTEAFRTRPSLHKS
ncbi:unnamed protein product [Amoebophrya sp. A25]|nr:unnamed protein product [Amoebophrya sp. A25]|eukprot:GSA25T00025869001.1